VSGVNQILLLTSALPIKLGTSNRHLIPSLSWAAMLLQLQLQHPIIIIIVAIPTATAAAAVVGAAAAELLIIGRVDDDGNSSSSSSNSEGGAGRGMRSFAPRCSLALHSSSLRYAAVVVAGLWLHP